MNPIDPPYLLGSPLGSAKFKSIPDDFQVEEILGFKPSGAGEHCFLWIEKTDRNSNDVADEIARRLNLRKRLVSHCGLKDKQAVTRQWFSLHLPGQDSPTPQELTTDGLRILNVSRNLRKLRRGSHDGNHFIIRLRNVLGDHSEIESRWQQIISRGVPNYFGPQRFGRNGNNLPQARRMLNGETEVRDRLLRGILISAARSYLFNSVVAHRVLQKTWDQPLPGEAFGFPDNRSLILPEKTRGDELVRHATGSLELTAPLWGKGQLQSSTDVRHFEQQVIQSNQELAHGLAQLGLKQERRVIRLIPLNPELTWENTNELVLRFSLPKGTYATTILRELINTTVESPVAEE